MVSESHLTWLTSPGLEKLTYYSDLFCSLELINIAQINN